jgi:hypothetical protein
VITLEKYAQAADTLFPIRGAWSYDAWAQINARFFDGALQPGPILWGLTAGCDFGSFNGNNNAITLHEALPGRDFAKQAKARGERDWVMADRSQALNSWGLSADSFGIGTALGTLLHEAMHQSHHQQGLHYPAGRQTPSEAHHNPMWLAECERVALMIGLPARLWPLYVERKERADEVRARLGAEAEKFTGKELNNRRRWIWAPTIKGQEIELEYGDDLEPTHQGQLVAGTSEITGFPRQSYKRHGIAVADRVALILGTP